MAGEMKHDHGMAKMDIAEHMLGDLALIAPFARETLPNQPVAGAFLTITNNGSEDDTLIGVSSSIAARGEVPAGAFSGSMMQSAFQPKRGSGSNWLGR